MRDEAPPRPGLRVRGRSFIALVLAPSAPLDEWLAALDEQAARSPAFFVERPVVLELGGLAPDEPGLTHLIEQLSLRAVRVIATEGTGPGWPELERYGFPATLAGGRLTGEIEPPAEDAPPPPPPPPPLANTLTVEEPVRSGQSIVNPSGDVVVLGPVASGAEVMAAGSIHIYGPLRGRAVAGITGNPSARIFCQKLEAELIAIDGLYRTAEDIEPSLRGIAVKAWLDGDLMMVAPLLSRG